MAMSNAPWFVEQPGVQHPSSIARNLAWAATGGQRGVIGPASLAVVPTSVPSGKIQVRPGGAVIPSMYAGAAQESYMVRNRTSTNLSLDATGSGGGRTDAIIVRIDDTGMTGVAPAAAQLQTYDYAKLQVIKGVTSGLTDVDQLNLAYPAVLLAKVTLPASTGTVTKAMITDLRHIAQAREEEVVYPRPIISSDPATSLKLASTQAYPDGEWWPNVGGQGDSGYQYIDIPKWATRMQIRAEWLAVYVPPYTGKGAIWVTYGPGAGSPTPNYATQAFRWDAASTTNTYRTNMIVLDEVAVPAALRGTNQPFVLRGNRSAGSETGRITLDAYSGISLGVRFLERPDTDLQAD